MHTNYFIVTILIITFFVNGAICQTQQFGKGVVPENQAFGLTLSPDKKEAYFVWSHGARDTMNILIMQQKKKGWSKPVAASFSTRPGIWKDIDPSISPDGNTLYFQSNRPLDQKGQVQKHFDIWAVDRTRKGWSEPYHLGPLVNSDSSEAYVTVSARGSMVFNSNRKGSFGALDIFMSKKVNGQWTTPTNLGMDINTVGNDSNPFISADESFLIMALNGRTNSYGDTDLFISFRDGNSWTKPWNLGPGVNTSFAEFCPFMVPGEDTLYFTRMERGKRLKENLYKVKVPVERMRKLALAKVEMFEPGNISDGEAMSIAFEKDGKSAYFVKTDATRDLAKIFKTNFENGLWSTPSVEQFSMIHSTTLTPTINTTGNTFLFAVDKKNMDLWMMEKNKNEWSVPRPLPGHVNTKEFNEYFGTLTANNTLYYSTNRGKGRGDIFKSTYQNGEWQIPESVEAINTENAESNPLIASDERYLIFMAERPEGFGDFDLYISLNEEGKWSQPMNLGPSINGTIKDFQPSISPDDKYFYFSRTSWPSGAEKRYGEENIYRVDLSVLGINQ